MHVVKFTHYFFKLLIKEKQISMISEADIKCSKLMLMKKNEKKTVGKSETMKK